MESKRKILFRGLHNERGWYYGDYCSIPEPHIMFQNHKSELDVAPCLIETVGMFTGLTDREGVMIFEGDLVKTDVNGKIWIVKFEDYGFVFESTCNKISLEEKYSFSKYLSLLKQAKATLKIVGNLHQKGA